MVRPRPPRRGVLEVAVKLGEYLTSWLRGSEDTVRRSTFARYEQISRVHLRPALGNLKLKSLSPAHVRDLYRQKLDEGLSPRTVRYIHVTLHKALKQAVRDGLIPRNATEAVKPPRPSRKEMRPLSPPRSSVSWKPRAATSTRQSSCWP